MAVPRLFWFLATQISEQKLTLPWFISFHCFSKNLFPTLSANVFLFICLYVCWCVYLYVIFFTFLLIYMYNIVQNLSFTIATSAGACFRCSVLVCVLICCVSLVCSSARRRSVNATTARGAYPTTPSRRSQRCVNCWSTTATAVTKRWN